MAETKDKGGSAGAPKAVVNRLSLYLRELQHLLRDGRETVSSTQLGSLLGFTDAQVRKDLAYFGQFGYPGIGYRCNELISAIKGILGTDRNWPVALVGLGNLGRALLGYKGFGNQGFRIVAAFDVDPSKVGKPLEGVPVYHLDQLQQVVKDQEIKIGVIAVPASSAVEVAEKLVEAGIDGMLNFAPVTISPPESVNVQGVDLAIEMEQLCYSVIRREQKG